MRPTYSPCATSSRDSFHDAQAHLRVLSSGSRGPSCAKCIRVLSDRDFRELSWNSGPALATQDIMRYRGIVAYPILIGSVVSATWSLRLFEAGCDQALGKLSVSVSSSCEAGIVSQHSPCRDIGLSSFDEAGLVSQHSSCRDIVVSPALAQLNVLISSCCADRSFSSSCEAGRVSALAVLSTGLSGSSKLDVSQHSSC